MITKHLFYLFLFAAYAFASTELERENPIMRGNWKGSFELPDKTIIMHESGVIVRDVTNSPDDKPWKIPEIFNKDLSPEDFLDALIQSNAYLNAYELTLKEIKITWLNPNHDELSHFLLQITYNPLLFYSRR